MRHPLFSPVLLLGLCLAAGCENCSEEPTPSLYETQDIAPSLAAEEVEALAHMGPTLIDLGVNFAVYSQRAERVDLLLFEDPDDDLPTRQFEMARFGDVWNLYVEGVGLGQAYGFVAWGPNWPYDADFLPGSRTGFISDVDSQGNRFNPNKLLRDPYARAVHRDHDWTRASLGTGESRREESTWGAAAKSLVVVSDYTWSDNETSWREARSSGTLEGHAWNELVLYEVHPKGLSANGYEGVGHPGTFQGIGEMAPYLADLGINALELLPIHEKPVDGGYWGYNNISFFAPELEYSAAWTEQGRADEVIDEFKAMVDALHQEGIEVILDVVYNHTGEGGLWREKLWHDDYNPDPDATQQAVNLDSVEVAGLYHFRGLDNWSYYALDEDGLTYWNNTGVGNQTRPNYTPMSRLILDSLHFLVEELHVDGFRFDLAGILGEQDLNYNEWYEDPTASLLGLIADDPVMQEHQVRLIAEPWTAGGSYGSLIGAYPASTTQEGYGWAEWNAHFRDIWRSMNNDDDYVLSQAEGPVDAGGALTGSQALYAWNERSPTHSINFVTSHDGFPMYDLFSFDTKQNHCGVLNPVCCEDPYSSWCDLDSGEDNNRSRDWGQENEALKRQLMRNLFSLTLLSHGTPMLFGGDEWMRTQYGNNNAYSTLADNEFNWFRWGEWQAYDERYRMHDFVRDLLTFRAEHTYALSPAAYDGGMSFAWKDADNADKTDWSDKHLMIHYYASEDDTETGAELVILLNLEAYAVDFSLPEGRSWARVIDTQAWFDTGDAEGESGWFADFPEEDTRSSANILLDAPSLLEEPLYGVPARSIVVLEAQEED